MPLLVNVTFNDERVQIDWQWPLSGVYSIMMVNSAQAGEGGVHGAWFPLFTPSTITSKVLVYSFKLRGQIHSSYFFSIPFLLCGDITQKHIHPPLVHGRVRVRGRESEDESALSKAPSITYLIITKPRSLNSKVGNDIVQKIAVILKLNISVWDKICIKLLQQLENIYNCSFLYL
jgi:hypothetical protein